MRAKHFQCFGMYFALFLFDAIEVYNCIRHAHFKNVYLNLTQNMSEEFRRPAENVMPRE